MSKIRKSCFWLIVGQLDSAVEKLHLFDQKHIVLFLNIHLLVFDDTFKTSTTRKKRLKIKANSFQSGSLMQYKAL